MLRTHKSPHRLKYTRSDWDKYKQCFWYNTSPITKHHTSVQMKDSVLYIFPRGLQIGVTILCISYKLRFFCIRHVFLVIKAPSLTSLHSFTLGPNKILLYSANHNMKIKNRVKRCNICTYIKCKSRSCQSKEFPEFNLWRLNKWTLKKNGQRTFRPC